MRYLYNMRLNPLDTPAQPRYKLGGSHRVRCHHSLRITCDGQMSFHTRDSNYCHLLELDGLCLSTGRLALVLPEIAQLSYELGVRRLNLPIDVKYIWFRHFGLERGLHMHDIKL